MTFLPPNDVASLGSLFQLLADPKAAQVKLDELAKISADATDQLDKLEATRKAVADQKVVNEKLSADLEAQKADFDALVSTEKPRLANLASVLATKTSELDDSIKKHNETTYAKEVELSSREKTVQVREDRVASREAEALLREQAIRENELSLKQKIQKLKDTVL